MAKSRAELPHLYYPPNMYQTRIHNSHVFGGGAGYLLDNYPGALAAYSLRALSAAFATADLILCRRASDDAELGFNNAEIFDGTLTTWASSGDVFVKTRYDQSGNGLDDLQSTDANQPKIVSSGSLITYAGIPAITNHTANAGIRLVAPIDLTSSDFELFAVYGGVSGQSGMLLSTPNANTFAGAMEGTGGGTGGDVSSEAYRKNGASLGASLVRGDLYNAFQNTSMNLVGISATAGSNGQWASGLNTNHAYNNGTAFSGVCYYNDWIIYPSFQTTDRGAINAEINAHYGLY